MTIVPPRLPDVRGTNSPRGLANPAGMLGFRIEHAGGVVTSVTLESTRPTRAARVLAGRTPAEAIMLVPLLFSLCGGAQTIAAKRAIRGALQQETTAAIYAHETQLLRIERIRDHGLRLLLDWPGIMGMTPDHDCAARLLKLTRALEQSMELEFQTNTSPRSAHVVATLAELAALFRHEVLGGPVHDLPMHRSRLGSAWLPRLLHQLLKRDWVAIGAGANVAPIEMLTPTQLARSLAEDTFIDRPSIDEKPRDNTAFARQYMSISVDDAVVHWGDGLAARLVSLASELDADLTVLQDILVKRDAGRSMDMYMDDINVESLIGGRGIGYVEAGRGRLFHDVTVQDGRIQSYRVVAPTEWNFHPQGLATQMLALVPFTHKETGIALARAVICAIDPCVGYHLEVCAHA